MKKKSIISMSRNELKVYIEEIQNEIQIQLSEGKNIDDFLDTTDLLDEFETILLDEEFSIFVITILHNIQKEGVMNSILDAIGLSLNKL
ncbi:MAG: hypothetical protein ISR83_00935 [Candidatus Marinimicrobia bacterium]|nr:hypothetical protein [Candidatus Neomarinimicrobiota bacterium]